MVNRQGPFTVSPHTTLNEPVVSAYLWNPPVDRITMTTTHTGAVEELDLSPALVLEGKGLPDGPTPLDYVIGGDDGILEEGTVEVSVADGWFEARVTPQKKHPDAKQVRWCLTTPKGDRLEGCAPLIWSRFKGSIRYLDEKWRSSYIDMRPVTWAGTATNFTLPVSDDGTFDALVPARVYGVLNVNGTGYSYDTMERWAWNYDLTRDREDEFVIGRTELYSMRAFDINGGPPTLFVSFRPTALSRTLRYDEDGDGYVRGKERERLDQDMKTSPTVIGPELTADDVKVWLNGRPEKIVQFDRIPEYGGGSWQVQYLLQIYPEKKPARGVWHEIKVEVESTENPYGEEVVDFGQGSVGFYRA